LVGFRSNAGRRGVFVILESRDGFEQVKADRRAGYETKKAGGQFMPPASFRCRFAVLATEIISEVERLEKSV
jgi:hypothetical protein